ncbi:MAG: zinc-dependent metalloprotease [Saprospiraceae bacterium]|nr:zinc-dependent metalloprotease [Saprospiraceae bacterium]
MKKTFFVRTSLIFLMTGWLFCLKIYAQQLICPDPFMPSGMSGSTFVKEWNNELSTGTKFIPTVVHLIGEASSLTYNQVKGAIDQLNHDFVDPNGVHTIVFVMASIAPDGGCTDGITHHPAIQYYDPLYRNKTGWPNSKYLNIWVLSDPDLLGAVTVRPSSFQVVNGELVRHDFIAGQSAGSFDGEDGVSVNTSEIYPNSSNGHTLTHETGHWLNLLHVFSPCEGTFGTPYPGVWECCHGVDEGMSQGDFIEDTPPQDFFATANDNDCGQTFTACLGTTTVTQDNFMSYGGPCINSFTNGQRQWMTHCLDNFRPDIWSESNLKCTGVSSLENPIITEGQNLSWTTSNIQEGIQTIVGTLTIESGGTLTIESGVTVQFCDEGKIIIKPGGRLNLYGTLTSICAGKMWQGVEVWGNPKQSQFVWPGHSQGRFYGYAGALVEHAQIGILVGKSTSFGSHGGGVVICSSVSFKNNGRAVLYDPFENKNPFNNQVTPNSGHFTTCAFEVDNDYRGDNPDLYEPDDYILFRSFADIKGVRGIAFTGCAFHNNRNNNEIANASFYGFGILSTESGFSVSGFCSAGSPTPAPCLEADLIKCSFKNLYVGIVAGNTDINGVTPYTFSVDQASFEGCWTGIRSTAGSRAFITRNIFKIGALPPFVNSLNKISGIALDDTHTSFTVQENSFSRDPAIPADVADFWEINGIEAVSIGEYNNLIRKNWFSDMKIGNRSVGANATPDGFIGLLYLCNENTGNDRFDFKIESNSRIRQNQGLPNDDQSEYSPAGNYFSFTGPQGSDSDFKNSPQQIAYYHADNLAETPLYFDANYLFKVPVDKFRSCESIFCKPPCHTESEIDDIKGQINADVSSRDSVKTLLASVGQSPSVRQARERLVEFLNYRIHQNVAEVTAYIAWTDGSNADFRQAMAQAGSYDADLALANDYLGSNEQNQYATLMNGIAAKYQLSGEALAEFNAYRSITDMLALHYANEQDKYNLGTLQIEWLKDIADNSDYYRSRGLARRLLRIYGYYYPVDEGQNTENRNRLSESVQATPDLFNVMPNPANQSVAVHLETGLSMQSQASIALLDINGRLLSEKNQTVHNSIDVVLPTSQYRTGVYLIRVTLDTGISQTKRLVILH